MINKILLFILTSFVISISLLATVYAKPSAPVKIEYSVPKNIEPGARVTTMIKLVAMTNLQQIVVSAHAYKGLNLLSGGERITLTNLQRGDVGEIEVRVQLVDEVGYLSVFATTTDSRGNTQSKSIAVKYGTVGVVTKQKMRPSGLVNGATGEKVILMPAEAR